MPILGILASSMQAAVGDYESIATVTVGAGGTTSVSFTSIPSTYTHLQIRALSLASSAGASGTIEFNSVTAPNANYYSHYLRGSGAAAQAGATAQYQFFPDFQGGSTSPGSGVLDILDYANTNKNKTIRGLSGYDANGSGYVGLTSGAWFSTAAITSITIKYTTILQYSSFALYGIR